MLLLLPARLRRMSKRRQKRTFIRDSQKVIAKSLQVFVGRLNNSETRAAVLNELRGKGVDVCPVYTISVDKVDLKWKEVYGADCSRL